MGSEWIEWHRGYDDDPGLLRRLGQVQRLIRQALDAAPAGPIHAVSMCAGDGRDLLGVLAEHPRGPDLHAVLVELDAELAAAARRRAAAVHLPDVEVRCADAGATGSYAGAVPAELVLVCGVFGNIADSDVANTIAHLPELCTAGATALWTRGRFEPDLTPSIRRWFGEAGFREQEFVAVPDSTASVGSVRFTGEPRALQPGLQLFRFLPAEQRPSRH